MCYELRVLRLSTKVILGTITLGIKKRSEHLYTTLKVTQRTKELHNAKVRVLSILQKIWTQCKLLLRLL